MLDDPCFFLCLLFSFEYELCLLLDFFNLFSSLHVLLLELGDEFTESYLELLDLLVCQFEFGNTVLEATERGLKLLLLVIGLKLEVRQSIQVRLRSHIDSPFVLFEESAGQGFDTSVNYWEQRRDLVASLFILSKHPVLLEVLL